MTTKAKTNRFAVAEAQPVRGDTKHFKYDCPYAAERAARMAVALRGSDISIWVDQGSKYPKAVALVLRDALGRIWTQVDAMPGQETFL